jgi:phospholipid/cholesterol/gamma-HCH transport system substrate-binding protein
MSTKPHYFKVGLFVIVAVVLVVGAVIIFGAGLFGQKKMYFETYFNESITGLSVGSLVEFRGVRIGQVEKIGFVGSEYNLSADQAKASMYDLYVRVVWAAPESIFPELGGEQTRTILARMVERGLRARVTSNILTQQAYLEANYMDPNRFSVMKIIWKPKYLYVPSAPSELTTMKDSIDKILLRLQEIDLEGLAASLQKLFASLDTAVGEVDVGQLSQETMGLLKEAREKLASLDTARINDDLVRLLTSLDGAVADANVPALSDEVQNLVAEIRATNDSLGKLLAGPAGTSVSAQTNVPEALARLNNVLARIDTLIATERPDIEVILANFREISTNLRDLTSTLKEQPSDLLFSKPPPKSEALK